MLRHAHQALESYTEVTEKYGDLALAEYARIGRGLCLYEVGVLFDQMPLLAAILRCWYSAVICCTLLLARDVALVSGVSVSCCAYHT